MASSPFDAFLQQCWAEHAEQPAAVAERLRSAAPQAATADQLAALARLAVHVCAEHLGAFDDARSRLAALADHPLAERSVQSALRVAQASLALAEHGVAEGPELTADESIRAGAAAAAIALGRGRSAAALALLVAARARLAALPQAGAAVHRPLAVACNNMAWELHDRGNARSEEDSAAMLDLAAASRLHWSQAGGWLEVERADYALALCHLAAGRADDALRFAERCEAACTQHAAPPFEHFHAREALARAQQARGDAAALARHVVAAEGAFDALTPDEREACTPTLAAVRALAR